jgi:ankyrin repeat protein
MMKSFENFPSHLFVGVLALAICLLASCKREQKTVSTPSAPRPEATVSPLQPEFFRAAQIGDNAAVKSFLDKGADVNLRGPDGATPVMEASYAGHLETVKLLLQHGADLSAKKKDGASAPTLTAQKELLELFADVSTMVDAAREGKNDIVKQMIDKGTPLNALDRSGFTALTEASWNGRTETVKLLLANGADPRIKKADGATPLDLAIGRKQDSVVAVLKEALAKQTVRNSSDASN